MQPTLRLKEGVYADGALMPQCREWAGRFAGGAEPGMDALVSDSAPERCE